MDSIQPDLFPAESAATPLSGDTERSTPKLEPSWLQILGDEFDKPYMTRLREYLSKEKEKYTLYPRMKDIFNAFWLTPFDAVKVVLLGQDPYHGPGQAHGLCFSVRHGVPAPPSLANIFRELRDDVGLPRPTQGDLTPWAQQGVFLLNTVLTVRANEAHAHAGQGWETFTDKVIVELSARRDKLVFLLWGRPAQSKRSLIDATRHTILQAPHPSPFSAHGGFFGCRHFSRTNEILESWQIAGIDWTLT